MKKRGRRILSVILTAVMVFALLPVFSKPMVVKAADPQEHVHDDQDINGSQHTGWKRISTWKELEERGKTGGQKCPFLESTAADPAAYFGKCHQARCGKCQFRNHLVKHL